MIEITVTLKGTDYSASRAHETPMREKEKHEDYDKRTWREKGHYDENDVLYIPAMGFKQALDSAASKLSIKIPEKGQKTYTKHFVSGVTCTNNLSTGIPKDKVGMQKIYAHANGNRGSGRRVWRYFPQVKSWEGEVSFMIMDRTVTPDIFFETLETAGLFVGVGRFRPENGGTNGRFEIVKREVRDLTDGKVRRK